MAEFQFKYVDSNMTYDGSQLRSLFAYENHGILGDSIVSWQGPCDVSKKHMVDGEDLFAGEEIRSAQMLHFIVELFDQKLITMVSLQRLLSSMAKDILEDKIQGKIARIGDDLFHSDKKLSISIATVSPVSGLIHFAMNTSNENTPVPTSSLADLDVAPQEFSLELMEKFVSEFKDITQAIKKVFWVR